MFHAHDVDNSGFIESTYDKETSFMLDTEMIKGLKDTINLNEDTPAEELFDKAVQGIEFTGLGYAFNKLFPMIKAMRKINMANAEPNLSILDFLMFLDLKNLHS